MTTVATVPMSKTAVPPHQVLSANTTNSPACPTTSVSPRGTTVIMRETASTAATKLVAVSDWYVLL